MNRQDVVPAYAGVILSVALSFNHTCCGSRIRGGDPSKAYVSKSYVKWFPHTRG